MSASGLPPKADIDSWLANVRFLTSRTVCNYISTIIKIVGSAEGMGQHSRRKKPPNLRKEHEGSSSHSKQRSPNLSRTRQRKNNSKLCQHNRMLCCEVPPHQ